MGDSATRTLNSPKLRQLGFICAISVQTVWERAFYGTNLDKVAGTTSRLLRPPALPPLPAYFCRAAPLRELRLNSF